ncbi:MAG: 3-oxoacyl-ACP reductase FabG [Actinobacteria bacterium]|nr:3-oxoacyl-ACP reductase FabG [Actinomycetota bacterium]
MTQQVALVTGAARGIGKAIARRLLRDGHAVALADLDATAVQQAVRELEPEGTVAAVSIDVGDADSVIAGMQQIATALGPIGVLVNNAGVTRDDLLFRMPVSAWDDVIQVHLRGAFLMSQAAQRDMIEAGFGRIVNISSASALGNRGQANYAAAKAGLQGFTKTLALELGPYGVTTNAVAPGFIQTDMTRHTAERLGLSLEDWAAQRAEGIAVRRVGEVEDVAHAVSFFAGPDAGFVNGQVLYVAGGPKG